MEEGGRRRESRREEEEEEESSRGSGKSSLSLDFREIVTKSKPPRIKI